jgi:hypothetical protein
MFQDNRRTKHLLGWSSPESIKNAKIADDLLPPDWGSRDKVVPFRAKKEEMLLDEIYEVKPKAQVYKLKFAAS